MNGISNYCLVLNFTLVFVTLTVLATGNSDVHFVVLQDELKPFVAKEQLSLLLGGAERVLYASTLNNCDIVCNVPVVHLTDTCLSTSDFRIPTVTVPINSTKRKAGRCAREIGLGHSAEGQMKVVALATSRFQWHRILLHTDEERSFEMLRLLGEKMGLTILSSVSFSDEVAINISVDAVVVHCGTRICYLRFIKMLKLWQEKETIQNIAWLVTEDTAWEIESKPTFWKDIFVTSNSVDVELLGIERVLPAGTQIKSLEEILKCNLFSHCLSANKRAQANLMSVYDAILVLESTVDRDFDEKLDLIFGASEPVVFESSGKARVYSSYNILRLSGSGKVAYVNGYDLMVSAPYFDEDLSRSSQSRRRRALSLPQECPKIDYPYHFNVTSVEERPFLFKNATGSYNGLIVDLMNELQKRMQFTYTIIPARGNKYGNIISSENGTVTATGMMAQLLDCEADLAVGPLFVTSEREKYISFADTCWMDASLTLYGYKRTVDEKDVLAFLRPFSAELWVTLLVTLLGYPIILSIFRLLNVKNRRSPKSFLKLYLESVWQVYGTMTQQGMETGNEEIIDVPIAEAQHRIRNTMSSRLLFGADTIPTGIQSVDELADQTNVQYGTVVDSAAERFFRTSSIDRYRRMDDYMKKTKGVMVSSSEEGYERVRNSSGGYVFIWGDLSLEYAVSTSPQCNTRLIGRNFDKSGYGIGMRRGQPYKRNFTLTLLELKDDGSVNTLRDRWITKAGVCLPNEQTGEDLGRPQPLKLRAFLGVFIILFVAVVLAAISWYCVSCCSFDGDENRKNIDNGNGDDNDNGDDFDNIDDYLN
ncbi:probable glutamate receptor isoform X2 [Oscarella lobularis]|uniref:probable glutamate receptor isoform X2 n=1 Tax=Oscarella lobularis TaxID=121494 RepID=UPI003313B250